MSEKKQSSHRRVKILRWFARGTGILFASFWLFIVIVSIFNEGTDLDTESAIMATLIFSSIFGVIVAWFREFEGGIILLVVAIAHSINALIVAGRNKGLAIAISGGPFLIIGSLFLAAWLQSRKLYLDES